MFIKQQDQSNFICEDHKFSELFDSFLADYQEDIHRIVQRYRKPYHTLSFDDLISECNLSLLKQKKKILESFNEADFTENDFKKIGYAYVRNTINWTHYREKNSKDYKNKVDMTYQTEDGPKTTFELFIENEGEENAEIEASDSTDGYKKFFYILSKYSYLLSDAETKLMHFLSEGWNQDKISEELGITRQAVSFSFVNLQKKLSSYFSFDDIITHDSGKLVSKGKKAIDSFFSNRSPAITLKDKEEIKSFVSNYPYQYNSKEINEKLFNGKYYATQISSFCTQEGINSLLCGARRASLDKEEIKKVIQFLNEGKSVYFMCKNLKRSRRIVKNAIKELQKSGD